MATRWTSKHTGQKIDDTIDCVCNPNLLDNWYFANPVNQRGQMEYNTDGSTVYTIDRWRERNSSGSVVVEGDGVRVTCKSTNYNMFFEQYIEPTADDVPVYASALITEVTGTVYMQLVYTDGTYSPSGGALKAGLKEVQGTKPVKRVLFQINKNGGSIKIKAAKLEYGNSQTLAHKDANGNWVLNEIPDYGEQLVKCKQSTADPNDIYANSPGVTGIVSNPNLLDNWYFGNPVNQRGGYVVPPGKPYMEGSTQVGTTDKYYTAIPFSTWYNITVNGVVYNVAASDVVRGYTGNWMYSFDRWRISPSSIVCISGGGLSVLADFQQAILSTALILGQKYTMSVLSTDGRLGQMTFTLQQDVDINYGFGFGFFVVFRDSDKYWFRLYGTNEATYLAIKLELGTTQTLAHREGDKWVLNEIPDYGEQLRRCQRYALALSKQSGHSVYGSGMINFGQNARIIVPLPVTMRALPAVSTSGTLELIADGTTYQVKSVSVETLSPSAVCLLVNSTELSSSHGAAPALLRSYGGGKGELLLSADL